MTQKFGTQSGQKEQKQSSDKGLTKGGPANTGPANPKKGK